MCARDGTPLTYVADSCGGPSGRGRGAHRAVCAESDARHRFERSKRTEDARLRDVAELISRWAFGCKNNFSCLRGRNHSTRQQPANFSSTQLSHVVKPRSTSLSCTLSMLRLYHDTNSPTQSLIESDPTVIVDLGTLAEVGGQLMQGWSKGRGFVIG